MLKLLEGFAEQARKVAGAIQQPPIANAITYRMPEPADKDLRNIEQQIVAVADAIDRYVQRRPQSA